MLDQEVLLLVVHRVGTHATGPRGKSPGKSPGKTPGKPPGRTRGGDHWAELAALIAHWQPRQLVVGVARHPDGAAHEMTERCERFARQLEGRFGLPVARVDERYSSAVLDPQAATDDQAAAVILQQWFDERADAGAGIRC